MNQSLYYLSWLNDHRGDYEVIAKRSTALLGDLGLPSEGKNPVMVAAGKKGAMTRIAGIYSFDEHLKTGDEGTRKMTQDVRDFILSLDETVEEVPKKFYVAYRVAQNFVCMEIKRQKVILFLKIDPSEIRPLPSNARDVRDIGHYGTGDFELTIKTAENFSAAQEYIRLAYERAGG